MTEEELIAWMRERGPRMIAVDAEMVSLATDRIEQLNAKLEEATHQALDMIAKVQMTNDGQWTFGNGVRYPTALGAAYAAVKSLLNEGEKP
jgi:hypothetical protein